MINTANGNILLTFKIQISGPCNPNNNYIWDLYQGQQWSLYIKNDKKIQARINA